MRAPHSITHSVALVATPDGRRQRIVCDDPATAANLALTLQCDGWEATVDPHTHAWAHDPANFEQANAWAIKVTRAAR